MGAGTSPADGRHADGPQTDGPATDGAATAGEAGASAAVKTTDGSRTAERPEARGESAVRERPEARGESVVREEHGAPVTADASGSAGAGGAPDADGAASAGGAPGTDGSTEADGSPETDGSPEAGAHPGADVSADTDAETGTEGATGSGSTWAPSRRFSLTSDTARPEGGGRAAPGDAPAPARQWPLLTVLGTAGIGLLLVGADPFAQAFRIGTMLMGAALLAGAVLRWVVPSVGMLAVRSRFTDLVTYGVMGTLIVLLALMAQPKPWLQVPFLQDAVHFTIR
ncbi:DUF3017 domain-containing protein [Streptomyces sp. NPDC006296]|uniref:DUF3017 domain-containing protein n=1 Tax=Streptomyces sp. NPDC006296 TaxID=3156746 RepID=UPI0033B16B5E